MKLHGVGMQWGVLNFTPGPDGHPFPQPPGLPSGWHKTKNFVDFDRFTITWKEKMPGDFRVVSLEQITESTWPLPDVPVSIPYPPLRASDGAPIEPAKYQIPSDLVVKFQLIDIIGLISWLA